MFIQEPAPCCTARVPERTRDSPRCTPLTSCLRHLYRVPDVGRVGGGCSSSSLSAASASERSRRTSRKRNIHVTINLAAAALLGDAPIFIHYDFRKGLPKMLNLIGSLIIYIAALSSIVQAVLEIITFISERRRRRRNEKAGKNRP